MAPSDYIEARKSPTGVMVDDPNNEVAKEQEEIVTMVDDRPYFPFLEMDPNNHDSIKKVVAKVLSASSVSNCQNDTSQWTVKVVTGGITNKLFQVSGIMDDKQSTTTTTSVLVRVFGGHGLIDRDVETSTFAALAHQGMAVGYLGRFANGRLEQYYPDMLPLEVNQMSMAATQIAQSLGKIHGQFQIPHHLKKYHDLHQEPTLWTQLSSWWNQAKSATFDTDDNKQRAKSLELEKLGTEITWLQESVVQTNNGNTEEKNKVGFCHNDLLAANILYSSSTNTIQLIDFEYGGINYLSYDIANHFNEYAGGTTLEENGNADYTQFPSEEKQRQFVTAYIQALDDAEQEKDNTKMVDDLLQEIKGFVLANHLVWGLWAVNQAASEGCNEFDYLQYAKCRIGQYWIDKANIYETN